MKQTAVEWLIEQLKENNMLTFDEWTELVEQAKEMEKEQIMDAYHKAGYLHRQSPYKYFLEEIEQYYNETFKSK